jgi:FkbH-like protein
MWQTFWSIASDPLPATTRHESSLPLDAVTTTSVLLWEEHCLECAVPECYQVCSLYVKRADGGCARFENGINPNPAFSGLYSYGADIKFRRWGKLEAAISASSVRPANLRRLDVLDQLAIRMSRFTADRLRRLGPVYRYDSLRKRLLRRGASRSLPHFDDFVIEVWNQQIQPVRLVLEYVQNGPRFRSSFLIKPGHNLYRVPVDSMNIDFGAAGGLIRAYPENDAYAHLVFTWLDFVTYSAQHHPAPHPGAGVLENGSAGARSTVQPAAKVKCVVWDLDNTVWEGILGEQEPGSVRMRPAVRETMLALDSKGILQTIASKNDHDHAWRALELLGLSHLFLYPRINWQPKSANIQAIVQDLNIGADACALVDDSGFERAEVASGVPGIRVYQETDVSGLLRLPEFDVPVTEESRQRREYYVAESMRKQLAESASTDYETFLRSCEMELVLFSPSKPAHVERSLELLQRTNQLNLSTRRYTAAEFDQLLADDGAAGVCTQARDRFGEYGIVGFASLRNSGPRLYLVDFVMSCRVAQKKVENAWFGWLASQALRAGYDKVYARYVATPRNHVLLEAFTEVGFTSVGEEQGATLLELDCQTRPAMSDIVHVTTNDLRALPSRVHAESEQHR